MGQQVKERLLEQKLEMRDKAHQWRSVADALYARAIYSGIICRLGLDEAPLADIAAELNVIKIPRLRGQDRRWTDHDVSRLLARVAALADEAEKPEAWAAKMQGFDHDLGVGLS